MSAYIKTNKYPLVNSNYGLLLVDSLRPSVDISDHTIPNTRQCVGTNRLWGANLGAAAHIDLVTKKIAKRDLEDLAVLSRSYLVVDDYMKDELIPRATFEYCEEWLANINNSLYELYMRIGENFDTHISLCKRADFAHYNRIWKGQYVDAYRSSIEKCLIFFMPYRLKSFKDNCDQYLERLSFLEKFFFCCQLLDDFHDIEEDIEKKANHNVFLENVPRIHWQRISAYKSNLLFSLLLMIRKNLTHPSNVRSIGENEVLKFYLDAGSWWLERKLLSISGTPLPELANQEFTDFKFDESMLREMLNICGEGNADLSTGDVRPEIFQTAYMGISKIDEV